MATDYIDAQCFHLFILLALDGSFPLFAKVSWLDKICTFLTYDWTVSLTCPIHHAAFNVSSRLLVLGNFGYVNTNVFLKVGWAIDHPCRAHVYFDEKYLILFWHFCCYKAYFELLRFLLTERGLSSLCHCDCVNTWSLLVFGTHDFSLCSVLLFLCVRWDVHQHFWVFILIFKQNI